MKKLYVLNGGLQTTIQDCGRYGLQSSGVPVTGGMDLYSLRWANKLVGNAEDLAAAEMTMQGASWKAMANLLVAVTGGQFELRRNGNPVPMWECFVLREGDELDCGRAVRGARAYLAVAGGLDVPVVMNSRSTYLRGGFGGWQGRSLRVGDELPVGISEDRYAYVGRFVPRHLLAPLPEVVTPIRVMLGPQSDRFTPDALAELEHGTYKVGGDSDRMAYRLLGNKLTYSDEKGIISDGVAPGSIQVPPNGQPIVMLADRQTTGGYPKIATVIGADLGLLGQLKLGDELRFVVVSHLEALDLWREHEKKLAHNPKVVSDMRRLQISVAGEKFNVTVGEVRK